jgi:hypothetical protein
VFVSLHYLLSHVLHSMLVGNWLLIGCQDGSEGGSTEVVVSCLDNP